MGCQMRVKVMDLSRGPGHWVHQLVLVQYSGNSGWRLSLNHDNPLPSSNLGNVNLQSFNHFVNLMVRIQEALFFLSQPHKYTLVLSVSVVDLGTKCEESQLRSCHHAVCVCVCTDRHVCK